VLEYVLILAVVGFVVGGLARLAVPGPDPMPIWATILLGLAGAYLGALVASVLDVGGGFLFAFAGAVLLVILYRRLFQNRGLTGPSARLRR
jgi:uncharacterized membrane protein YeaQ/YmgE (transglycosylase-associated protein family)